MPVRLRRLAASRHAMLACVCTRALALVMTNKARLAGGTIPIAGLSILVIVLCGGAGAGAFAGAHW